jgi:hypothetical protein
MTNEDDHTNTHESKQFKIYLNMNARTHAHTHARTRARTHVHTHARTQARAHARAHARKHARTWARKRARTHEHSEAGYEGAGRSNKDASHSAVSAVGDSLAHGNARTSALLRHSKKFTIKYFN